MSKKKFNHGKSKMISSYGGIGSVVETLDNSVIIETFDNWFYPSEQDRLERYIITDDRILSRIRYIFKNLQYIAKIPDEYDKVVSVKSNYFPKWFYCPNCKKFDSYSNWKKNWHDSGVNLEKFYPPKCYTNNCKEIELEQVRFVMTCPNGHIQDIPWQYWNNRNSEISHDISIEEDGEENIGGRINLIFEKCCNDQKLVYKVSRENSELSGIHIRCESCGKSEDLGGIFGFKMKCNGNVQWLDVRNHQSCEEKLKVVIKSSNSIYYSNIISSIYIPVNQIQLSEQHRILISNWLDRGKSKTQIIDDMKLDYNVPESITNKFLESGEDYISEQAFREVEYDYFLSKELETEKDIKFSKIDVREIIPCLETIIRIDKLKQISIQTSFTRQLPIDVDAILLKEDDFNQIQYEVKRQSTSKNNINTRFLPGVESFGEALLFIMDKEKILNWSAVEEIRDRVTLIKNCATNSQRNFIRRKSQIVTPVFILIHTLSHIIIKELEYVCGYPAASLRERIYVGDNMFGFMIMAIEGSEGSLGGLVSQCNDIDNLKRIIKSALERARDCSSDPICWNSDGQGVENLNLAACYSCALLPDVSCEELNCFLDRQLLIDHEIGLFIE